MPAPMNCRSPRLLGAITFAAAITAVALAAALLAGRPAQAGQVCLTCWYATPVAAGIPGGAEDSCAFADQQRTCKGINMSGRDWSNQDWHRLNLQDINLSSSNLTQANLQASDLRNADLSNANLTRSNLREGNLSGADLSGVRWANTVCPDGSTSDNDGGTCANNLRGGSSEQGQAATPTPEAREGGCSPLDPRCGSERTGETTATPTPRPGCTIFDPRCP